MRITKKKLAAVLAGTAVVALGTTAAFAYFVGSSGSGQNTGTVGSATQWRVVADAATGGPLLPGSGTLTAGYSVVNDSEAGQYLTSVTAAIDADLAGDVTNGPPGCKAEWFTIVPAGDPAGVVAPHTSNNGVVTITMQAVDVDQSACSGHALPFTVTAV